MNKALEHMVTTRADKAQVKALFIQYFNIVWLLGPLHTVTLRDYESNNDETLEAATALFLLDTIWGLQQYCYRQVETPEIDRVIFEAEPAWTFILEYEGDW